MISHMALLRMLHRKGCPATRTGYFGAPLGSAISAKAELLLVKQTQVLRLGAVACAAASGCACTRIHFDHGRREE